MTSHNVTHYASESDARGKTQGWLQVDKKAHQAMAVFGAKNGKAIAVLNLLTARLNRGTNAVIMSHESIASILNITPRTVRDSTQKLEEANFIQILKTGTANVYVINSRVAWQGTRGMRHAAFNAEILITEKEQTQPVDELIKKAGNLQHVPIVEDEERYLVGNDQIDPPDQQEMELP